MASFPPKLPWGEIYVRSGLKTLSDRVRQRPLVRRVRGAVDDLKSTVRNVARQQLPQATAAAERVVRSVLGEDAISPSPLINATGVIAPRGYALPLAEPAIAAMNAVGDGCKTSAATLESLLVDLTGAEAAIVFHSSAAAGMAAFAALGGPAVVARNHVGELDAIPLAELAALAGTRLREIGSVGRVSRDDYRAAFQHDAAGCVWYARPQSIAIEGDVTAPVSDEVFALARDHRRTSIEYLEAATLVDLDLGGTTAIPIVGASLLAGADLVIFPGDRFVGGPSCGVVVGKSALVARIAAHPLTRLSVLDDFRSAALIATLQLTQDRTKAASIPMLQLLTTTSENLRHRADRLAAQLAGCPWIASAEVVPCPGYFDDGRLPSRQVPGWGVAMTFATAESAQRVQKLLEGPIQIAVAHEDNRVLINLRSVLPPQDAQIAAAFQVK